MYSEQQASGETAGTSQSGARPGGRKGEDSEVVYAEFEEVKDTK